MKKTTKILGIALTLCLIHSINFVQAAQGDFYYGSSTYPYTVSLPIGGGSTCLTSNGTLPSWGSCGGGGGGTFPFTPVAGGNATSTVIYHYAGLTSLGSTTIQYASSTAITVPNLYATNLSNLTSNGFVKTTGGNGALSIDASTYLTSAVTSVTLGTPNSTLTLSGTNPVTTTGTINADLNLAHGNYWTALQNFTNASTSQLTATSSVYLATVNGVVGIATTSPGSLFSIGGILNATTATTTFYSSGGIDFASTVSGCPITVAGVCQTSTILQASAFKAASNYAATTTLAGTPTYSNGVNGVGATLTEVGNGALYVDGNSPAAGDRILVKNQTSAFQNGIYTVTATGSGIASYILTRATDFNSPTDVFPGVSTYVIGGTSSAIGGNAGEIWSLTTTGAITIGTTNLTFAEGGFSGVTAGTGISVSGSTVSVNQASSLSWTGLEQFTNASTTQLTLGGRTYDSVNSTGASSTVLISNGTNPFWQKLATSQLTNDSGFGGGTVTAVSVASSNGFAGSSSGGATPALTLQTSITGVLKGNGTALSSASAGLLTNLLDSFDGTNLISTGTPALTAGYFISTSTTASTFPYASTTALTIGGTMIYGDYDKSAFIGSTTMDSTANSYSVGTSTWNIWNPSRAVTMTKFYCKTDTGTTNAWIGTGTASSTMISCTSSGTATTPSVSFASRGNVFLSIGSQSSSNETTITATFTSN